MLSTFDPLVAEWFATRFGQPTEPQVEGWPRIREGRDVLIAAPTGSGKTLAAFLIAIDGLVRRARLGPLPDSTEVVYVSPLKALSNDVHKNLEVPLGEIAALARQRGIPLAPIRTAVRTGDTPQPERERMTREAPHILVTTPESLYILLTARRPRKMLAQARTVIVDEIHAVADDKRGAHLALSLARLDRLIEEHGHAAPQRIGLSATVRPIDAVAAYLNGGARTVAVADIGHRRAMELAVEVPRDELGPVASTEMWGEIYDRVAALIRENRTTLVFVNTRRLAERVALHLAERLGAGAVLPHHGSLSRRLRLEAERRLKNGELRAVVATASLELGIDVGTIDLVVQIGSPRSIAVGLQRVGRAGHWVGALPKGRLFATTRDDLVECAALVRAIRAGELDRLEIPRNSLDILAQQIVATCAAQEPPVGAEGPAAIAEDDLYALVRQALPYRTLPREDFDSVVQMLAEGISTARGRAGAWLHRDAVNRRLRARRGARLAAITSGGAIPDTSQYQVAAEPEGITVGMVDEDFAVESSVGDVFLLGTTSWRIRRVESGKLRVEDARGAAPTVPFWRGEAPGRTFELSREVARLREEVAEADDAGRGRLAEACGLERHGAEQLVAYVEAGRAALGAVPGLRRVVAERFFDEAGGMQLILHAPFGGRINKAWGLALRKRFCRSFNFELQAAATDNGIVISLGEQHSFPLDIVFEFLRPETVEEVLTQALLPSPMFAARWRWNAARSLAIPRYSGGRKVPPPIQRMRADDLMAAVFPDQAACPENLTGEVRIPDHPLVRETIDNCLHEAMDLDGLRVLLRDIQDGEIATLAVDTAEPSPFSHEILNANPYAFLDDAPLEERRTRAVAMRSSLRADYADGAGALDADAIARVAEQAWPPMRDGDELHEALFSLVVLPAAAAHSGAHRLKPVPPEISDLALACEGSLPPALVAQALACEGSLPPALVAQALACEGSLPPALVAQALACEGSLPPALVAQALACESSLPPALVAQALACESSLPPALVAQALACEGSLPPALVAQALACESSLPPALVAQALACESSLPPALVAQALACESSLPPALVAQALACESSLPPALVAQALACEGSLPPALVAQALACESSLSTAIESGNLAAQFASLVADRRAATLQAGGREFWIAAERVELIRRAYPGASIEPELQAPDGMRAVPESPEACAAEILRGWFECSGPRRAEELAALLALSRGTVDQALAQLEAEGQILRGRFTPGTTETEWCHRRLLARIHRLTIGRLRREIEPVTTAEFQDFLERWQHLAPGTQLHGVDGTLAIIRQLQGAEFASADWETEVLPRRVANYEPEYLDQLCFSGEVSWGRLSPHPAFERLAEENGRRVRPTRVAPLAIFLREDAGWLMGDPQRPSPDSLSHPAREVLAALENRGASFFTDLTRATGRLASEVEDALWELVAAGLVTADGFENLRALIDPKRRRGEGKGRTARPRHAPGRWSLLGLGSGSHVTAAERVDAFARQLLNRWGVLFRDAAYREPLAPAWRDLLGVLRRMEAGGEIRGGRFVESFIGEQFARPEALDLLRAVRRERRAAEDRPATLSLPMPASQNAPMASTAIANPQ